MAAELEDMLDLHERWVRGFVLYAVGVFLTRKATLTRAAAVIAAARATLPPLSDFRDETIARLVGMHYPHFIYWLLDEKSDGAVLSQCRAVARGRRKQRTREYRAAAAGLS